MIKSEYKDNNRGVKYQAKNYGHDVESKDQASDYYIGIYLEQENKVHMVRVNGAYQFI